VPSPSSCTAVGSTLAAPTVVEHWDGTTWTAEQPAPTSGGIDALRAISCRSISRCVAVGEVDPAPAVTGPPAQPLVEVWDGSSWSPQVIPITDGGSPTGAACPTPTNCVAVGQADGNPPTTLAEGWDGTGWTRQATQDPVASDQLVGVSCAMTTQCMSVGWGSATLATTNAVAEAWNGSSWQLQVVPVSPGNGPPTQPITLASIACPVPAMCMAVGSTVSRGLAELYQ
jgi:hypothetical protein